MSTKVLIIDDDIVTSNSIKEALCRAGFEVLIANSGSEGVELVRQAMPNAVTLDLVMPGMDGWQTCRQIRALQDIPIIALSEDNDPDKVMAILEAGADDLMLKPVAVGALTARLRTLVASRHKSYRNRVTTPSPAGA